MLVSLIRQTSPGRFTVELDDGSEVKTTLGVVTDMRLFAGKELDAEGFEELKRLSRRSIAREKALEYLSKRPMSCAELRKKLIEKGEDEDTAEFCVRWLSENGFLNDESYAAAVARHYTSKGYGEGRIRSELSRRGISREIWDETIGSVPEESSKLSAILGKKLKDPNDRDEVRKLSASLYRRGFSWDEIRRALSEYNASTEDE